MSDPAKAADAAEAVVRRLHRRHGGCALGAGLQRGTLHHEVGAHGRRRTRSTSIRSRSRSTTTTSGSNSTMCKACDYTIHGAQHHFGWDNSLAPADARRAGLDDPRSTVMTVSAGQLGPSSTVADVVDLDFGKINPVSGPIFVEGAEPGDALKVTLDSFAPQLHGGKGFGWTANIPGFGLLADQFTDPALHVWSYDPASMAPALWARVGARAAEALRRHHRHCAGRAGPALRRAAAPGRRQPRHPRPDGGRHALPAGRGRRARCSASATPMPRRATARSAARRSKARWTWC